MDTNIIVYLMSGDVAKADTAERMVANGGVISIQVLNEFTAVARRKLDLSWTETKDVLRALKASLEVVPLTLAIHERAVAIAGARLINIYDASILAAATENGCDVVLSEDLQHGQVLMGLRIENPFL